MLETAVKRQHEELLNEGIERGLEKGIKEGKIEDALKLIQKGMDNSFIQDITDLSLSEIKALRKNRKLPFNKIKSNFSSKK